MSANIIAITLNYRRAELTARCVRSLLGQVGYVCVVDNSNNHFESADLKGELEAIGKIDLSTPINMVAPESNLGFGKGMQAGLECAEAHGQYDAVLIINNDAVASIDMVRVLSQRLRHYGGIALVSPDVKNGSTPSMLWYHRFFALVLDRPCLGAFPYLSGACLLVPASLARPFLFDPDFFMYGEDVELSWRVVKSGGKLVVVDSASYEHAGSISSRIGSLFYEYHVARGHILLARKLAANRLDWLWLLFGRTISLPLRACVRCTRHKSLVPWVALVRACLNKPPPAPD